MRIFICEDNHKERMLLKSVLIEHYNDCSIEEFDNGDKLIEALKKSMPEIILLDVEMPGINGIETAKKIRAQFPDIHIVFITGHSQFALEAFNVYAFDYIVKPLDVNRLLHTLDMLESTVKTDDKYVCISNQGIMFKIIQKDILFIEKMFNKCIIYTDNFTYITIKPLRYFEKELDTDLFVKTHKAFIVNKKKVKTVIAVGNQTYEIKFDGTEKTAALSRGMNKKVNLV